MGAEIIPGRLTAQWVEGTDAILARGRLAADGSVFFATVPFASTSVVATAGAGFRVVTGTTAASRTFGTVVG